MENQTWIKIMFSFSFYPFLDRDTCLGDICKQCRPRPDQGLHSLLTGIFMQIILYKSKFSHETPKTIYELI